MSDAAAAFAFDAMPGYLVRRAQQAHSSLWAARIGTETTPLQFGVLTLLSQRPDIDQRTLATLLTIDTSTLADVCRRLADKGLLERQRDEADARRYVLRVSADGQRLLDRLVPAADEVGRELLAPLSEEEGATLADLLSRIAAAVPDGV